MKALKIACCTLLCLLCLIAVALPISAEEGKENTVTVLGNATVEAPADGAVIHFEIASHARVLDRAQSDNDSMLLRVREALQDMGRIEEKGYYTREGFSGVRFCATRCLSLVTECVSDVDAIVSRLHELGVSAIGEVSYFSRDTSAFEAKALKLAVADAKMKAVALGCMGEPCTIRDVGCFCMPYGVFFNSNEAPVVLVEASVEACFLR